MVIDKVQEIRDEAEKVIDPIRVKRSEVYDKLMELEREYNEKRKPLDDLYSRLDIHIDRLEEERDDKINEICSHQRIRKWHLRHTDDYFEYSKVCLDCDKYLGNGKQWYG